MKTLIKFTILGCFLTTLTGFVRSEVIVTDAWVRATVPNQKATGAFMNLTSKEQCRLVSATSPLTGVVELHEMVMEDDTMKMREVKSIELSAGKPTDLVPGGYHIMLLDLKNQLKEGDSVTLQLVFEKQDGTKETAEVSAKVRALASNSAGSATKKPHCSCCDEK